MKTLKCDLCDETAEGETFEDWMKAMMPHYMAAHAELMKDPSRGKAEQEQWMRENRTRFDKAR